MKLNGHRVIRASLDQEPMTTRKIATAEGGIAVLDWPDLLVVARLFVDEHS